jgi:hypothetical protein
MKSKSSAVSKVFILAAVALDLFHEEGLYRDTYLFLKGSVSSLDGVTSPFFCSTSFSFISSISSSPPHLGDMESIFPEVLLRSWTSSVFFIFLGLGVSCMVSGLSGPNISAGSTGMRRSVDQSLMISSRSSYMRL